MPWILEYAFARAIDFYNRKNTLKHMKYLSFNGKRTRKSKLFLQALIQISVAMNKVYVNVNLVGALSQARLALEKLLFLKSNAPDLKNKLACLEVIVENLKRLIDIIERKELDTSDYAPPELVPELVELVF